MWSDVAELTVSKAIGVRGTNCEVPDQDLFPGLELYLFQGLHRVVAQQVPGIACRQVGWPRRIHRLDQLDRHCSVDQVVCLEDKAPPVLDRYWVLRALGAIPLALIYIHHCCGSS